MSRVPLCAASSDEQRMVCLFEIQKATVRAINGLFWGSSGVLVIDAVIAGGPSTFTLPVSAATDCGSGS